MENIRIYFVLPEKYSRESQATLPMLEAFAVNFNQFVF